MTKPFYLEKGALKTDEIKEMLDKINEQKTNFIEWIKHKADEG